MQELAIHLRVLNPEVFLLGEIIKNISSLIEESSFQLSELKNDVSNIQVKSQDFTGIIEDVTKSVVSVITDVSQGSGVIIKSDGYIVTNVHVLEDARRIRVISSDKEVYSAKLIGYSKTTDIALLKIDADDLDYLKFGDSDDVKPGQRVIAVGNPAGLDFSVTEGIVSAVHRKVRNEDNEYIQTDVPINPGNSGGPLINIKKEIIGINNFKIGGFESLGFAIESNLVKDVTEEIFQKLEEQQAQQNQTQ
ncbi:trypsin-like peptidase domain-containing protein [Candidatus Woesearchaeota archaeon]|nr:trypsin-like peptidase domain-containing protein [Candidatus Woesearchaeota archaeon]